MNRKEYMARNSAAKDRAEAFALHCEYYRQYVDIANVRIPADLLDTCREALKNGDHYFNSPYTHLREWDNLSLTTQLDARITKLRKENGEGWSLSFNTCVLKEAARKALEVEAAAKEA